MGREAIGFYISGQLLTEDYHAFNKLARAVIGTPHIDSNSRLCMSSAVVGYKQSPRGRCAAPQLRGHRAGRLRAHQRRQPGLGPPILFRRLEAARERKLAAGEPRKLIVIDPRRTETAELADLHLQIRAGTDVALCHGLLHAIIWNGHTAPDFIAQHTEGFEALKALVRDWTPRAHAQTCGVPRSRHLAGGGVVLPPARAASALYAMGLNQSSAGTAKNTALINLHLAAGQIGRAGLGPSH